LLLLDINFYGPGVTLTDEHLKALPRLKTVTISGNVHSISSHTFQHAAALNSLTIRDTFLDTLPDDLFVQNNSIEHLNLERNLFTDIPVKIFSKIPDLVSLNLANNCIKLHNCDTIGLEFKHLASLQEFNMAGMTGPKGCGINELSKSYFSPINPELVNLNMSDVSHFWKVDATVLAYFTHLQELDLSGVAPYKTCPDNAKRAFIYFPGSLRVIYMQRWRTIFRIFSDCYFSNAAMDMLKKLPNLIELNFKYSDFAFGSELQTTVFTNFTSLQQVNLAYCRISIIPFDAFDFCPNLKSVVLDGNPLGARRTRLQTSTSSITELSLKNAGIASDEYQNFLPIRWLVEISHLKSLDLSRNYLHTMPLLAYRNNDILLLQKHTLCHSRQLNHGISVTIPQLTSLENLNLNDNFLHSFIDPIALDNTNMTQLCINISALSVLKMENNKLTNLYGICPSLAELYLKNNNLGANWYHTAIELSKLKALKILDLSDNNIPAIPNNLTSQMTNLEIIKLRYNNISNVQRDTFLKNLKLREIDMSLNRLVSFDIGIAPLLNLQLINLGHNQITNFTHRFLEELENSLVASLNIDGNTFSCDCDNFFKSWLLNNRALVTHYQEVRCSGQDEFVYSFQRNVFECDTKIPLIATLSVIGSIILTAVIAVPCYKFRWFVSHPKVVWTTFVNQLRSIRFEKECTYDAFISYDSESQVDVKFLKERIIPAVEKKVYSYKYSLYALLTELIHIVTCDNLNA